MSNVDKQRNSNGKLEGGITGKGFKKGQSGNPKGRPKGKTIKELVKEWLEENPDDMKAFVQHFVKKNKELAWQMLEGRPSQDIKATVEVPEPLLAGKSNDTSNPSNKQTTGT